jgi:hypothetical protein
MHKLAIGSTQSGKGDFTELGGKPRSGLCNIAHPASVELKPVDMPDPEGGVLEPVISILPQRVHDRAV